MSSNITLVGRKVGSFTILRKLGEGGMGAVYEAIDKETGRHVAIKFLHATYAHDEELLGRFFNEALASNSIDHPGMVRIFESGMLDGETPYLVMEYLRGSSLEQRLASPEGRNGLPPREALNVAWQTAAVLAELAQCGVVHRDLKPGNLMLIPDAVATQGVRVKILDLGLAKLNRDLFVRAVHTRCGVVMGTPLYMSPEQCADSSEVDSQADVYSLGIVLFEMLAGQPPYNTACTRALLALHMFAPVPRLEVAVPGVPAALAELVTAMLGKLAAQRPTMAEVRDRLAALLAQPGALFTAKIPTASARDAMLDKSARVAAEHAKTDIQTADSSDLAQTRRMVSADTVVRDTALGLRPPSIPAISERDLTAGFLRVSQTTLPLYQPQLARNPVLMWCLVCLVAILMFM